MVTADSVKAKIQGLISKANAKTGRSDADMTNAVNALVSGYNPNGITPSGTINITSNGTHDVKKYASANVNVPTGTTPTETINITTNGSYNVTNYATANVNVPTGITPSGSITITANGTHNVTNYASAVVNVPTPTQYTVVKTVTIDSDLGNGTNTTKTILTADEFVKAHYADDGFSAMLIPITQIASATGVGHSVYHCNFNIGSTTVPRYGFYYYSSSASAIAMGATSVKLNGNGYNISLRAKNTGNIDLYVASNRTIKAGTYQLVLTCIS